MLKDTDRKELMEETGHKSKIRVLSMISNFFDIHDLRIFCFRQADAKISTRVSVFFLIV